MTQVYPHDLILRRNVLISGRKLATVKKKTILGDRPLGSRNVKRPMSQKKEQLYKVPKQRRIQGNPVPRIT
jgi:hypothetical protein